MRLLRILFVVVLAIVTLHGQVDSPSNINIQDEGVAQGAVRTVNCTGTGITCSVSGSTATLNASGGGGGNALDVTIDLITHTGDDADPNWMFTLERQLNGNPVGTLMWVDSCKQFIGGSTTSNFSQHSSDGTFWWTLATPFAIARGGAYAPSLNRVIFLRSTVGDSVAWSDSCGAVWNTASTAESNTWEEVVWSPDLSLFVAVASSGTNQVMTSSDGISWTAQAEAEANQWLGVTWSPTLDLFAAVSQDGSNRAMTSPDGSAWTARALSSASTWQDVVWADSLGLFVAVANDLGANARVATSSDGITWDTQTAPTGEWSVIEWASEISLLVAGGTDEIMTSRDGVNWTERELTTVPGYPWNSGAWSSYLRRFVISANDGLGSRLVATSSFAVDPGLVYTVTVTGQSWVTSSSRILCAPFGSTTDGLTPETVFASGVQAVASNRVVGTGFDLSVYTPHGATGTYRFHCTGS